DRGLLDRPAPAAAARGSLPERRHLPRLELARDRRDGGRLRARLGRPRHPAAEAAVRLRLVRRLLRGGRGAPRARAARNSRAPTPPLRPRLTSRHIACIPAPRTRGMEGLRACRRKGLPYYWRFLSSWCRSASSGI